MFIYTSKSIVLATHVDDILVFASNTILVNSHYKDLSSISKLEINNLGEIKEFLRVEIIRDRKNKSLLITQRSFINKILTKFNKLNNRLKSIPILMRIKLEKLLEPSSKIKRF
jgi:hypothetical protein